MRRFSILTALAFALSRSFGDGTTLRSVAQLGDFADRTPDTHVRFELTGTVLETGKSSRTNYAGIVLLEDSTGRAYAFYDGCGTPSPGDVIHVTGDGQTDAGGYPLLCVRRMRLCGRAALPGAIDVPLCDLNSQSHDYRVIRTEGTLIDAFRDEMDDNTGFLLLKEGDAVLPAAIDRGALSNAQSQLGARLRVCGRYNHRIDGIRRFSGPFISLKSPYEVLRPAPKDPFDVPPLEFRLNLSPRDISRMEKRRVDGMAIAAWSDNCAMLRTREGHVVNLELVSDAPLPAPGDAICAVGYPQTDLFRINLVKASWRTEADAVTNVSCPPPREVTALQLAPYAQERDDLLNLHHGRTIRLDGIVQSCRPPGATADGEIVLSCDGRNIRIICPKSVGGMSVRPGSVVRVTGICNQPCDTWQPYMIFPHIRECQIILLRANDIRVLANPPWLTPARLAGLLMILVSILVGIIIWNRRLKRMIERRSDELAQEQISHLTSELKAGERTRLAVELHDALSQNLAAMACLIDASENALPNDPRLAQSGLRTASRMLKSCRTELRHCLFDLRNDTLEESNFDSAIRQTLAPLEPEADISVRTNIPRDHFHDASAHAILCIIRELVSNALRHAHATEIRIAGSEENGRFLFSVSDNGCGFDPNAHPGPAEGHFGIDGIRERLNRLNGCLSYSSRPGLTYARFEIPFRLETQERQPHA